MEPLPAWAIARSGAMIGCVVGYATRRGRLCTFGALEDAFLAQDFRRLKALAFALGLAIVATQGLIAGGLLPSDTIRYLPNRMPVVAIAAGGLLFGFGMALVGACAFGSLVRLGGGDLRSLVIIILFAVMALALLRGSLAGLRPDYVEPLALALAGGIQSDLAALTGWLLGGDMRLVLSLALAAALMAWALRDRNLRSRSRLLLSGIVLGLGVVAGWLVTGVLADDMALAIQAESLTFVSPVANALHAIALPGRALWDFGIASVLGVVAGSWLASIGHDEFHWEAYDDSREMKRHLVGAIMMGAGGVLAGGCTIGQGLTAGSVLALSWPLAVGGMVLGARLGLYILVEGSLGYALARLLDRETTPRRRG
jgi:uncharacterized membrane protein YedE/YeeE